MPRFRDPKKGQKVYDYKVYAVDTVEQQLLDEMSECGYELDYAITRPDKIYLVFRRYAND